MGRRGAGRPRRRRSSRRSARPSSRAAWEESASGLTPLDAATQVAIPEFDGRLLGGVDLVQGARLAGVSRVGTPVAALRARPRALRAAWPGSRCARRGCARCRPRERRVAVLLTSFPTKHARVGMAVGLDTPASAHRACSRRCAATACGVDAPFADGDELMHALIATGGHDAEFLTDDQLAASPLRLPVADYLAWFADAARRRCARRSRSAGGPPPGERYVDGDDFVVAGLELGNVLVAIQPPRGYGEDPVGDLPRPRAAADAPLPRLLPVARPRLGRRRDRAPRQARHARVAARQDARALGRLRARRRARRHAARLPVRRQRPRARACRPSGARTR